MAIDVLSAEEIKSITGLKRFTAQINALQSMGIDVIRRPDGSPVVNARHFDQVTGVSELSLEKHNEVKLDLSA